MLDDLLVLDLSTYLPGPYATWVMAQQGARVIKVEAPGGDPTRHLPPFDAEGVSATFRALNQGKTSLGVDLKHPEGQALLLRLVERADVLIEGFRPGVATRLGVGPEACSARNPRLVYCSLSGYGQEGPYRERAGHDLTYQAYAGALSITSDPQGSPVAPGVPSSDLIASMAALSGILCALHERQRSGRGRVVDASMLDALVSAQGLHFQAHWAGAPATPRGMPLNGGFPCYEVYPTSDEKFVALAALEPKFWRVFCEITDREDWLGRQFDPDLRPELLALFATRSRDEWRLILESSGCCLAPVLDYDEVEADPQVEARELLDSTQRRVAPPFRFDPPGPAPARHLAAEVGADTPALLGELLGLGAEALAELRASGVFGA